MLAARLPRRLVFLPDRFRHFSTTKHSKRRFERILPPRRRFCFPSNSGRESAVSPAGGLRGFEVF